MNPLSHYARTNQQYAIPVSRWPQLLHEVNMLDGYAKLFQDRFEGKVTTAGTRQESESLMAQLS
jgi:hypothetical protein